MHITNVEKAGDELKLEFRANFSPEMSNNHIHVWWGDAFTINQVSMDAGKLHGAKRGNWTPTEEFPSFVTTGTTSLNKRGKSHIICVSAAEGKHNILDVSRFECIDVAPLLKG